MSLKFTAARRAGLLACAVSGRARVSNTTNPHPSYYDTPTVYWQTAEWLVRVGLATEQPERAGMFVCLTPFGVGWANRLSSQLTFADLEAPS